MFHAILGFRIEQYNLSMQKHVHLRKCVCAWVAATMGEYVQAHEGKGEEMTKIHARGPTTPTLVPRHPHVVATHTSALCNP